MTKRGAKPKFRKKVFQHLLYNGPKTPTEIHREWLKKSEEENQDIRPTKKGKGVATSQIIRALSELNNPEVGLIFNRKIGREARYYISEKGLLQVIHDKNEYMSSNEFWNHLLYLLDLGKITEKDPYELIREYENRKLQVDEQYSYSEKTYRWLYKKKDTFEIKRLTNTFDRLRKISQEKLIEAKKFDELNNNENDLEQFVDKISDGGEFIKFTLGKFGFLFILQYYLLLFRNRAITKEKFRKDVTKFIDEHGFQIPKIFGNKIWIKLRTSFGDRIEDILSIFDFIWIRSENENDALISYRFFIEQRNSLLINSQHELSLSYHDKLNGFWQEALEIYKKWENNKSMLNSPFTSNVWLSDKVLQTIFDLKKDECEDIRSIHKIRANKSVISSGLDSDILAGLSIIQDDGTEEIIQKPINEDAPRYRDSHLNSILDIIYEVSDILDQELVKFENELILILKKYNFANKLKVYKNFIQLYKEIESFNKIQTLWKSIGYRMDATGLNEGRLPYPFEEYQGIQSSDAAQNIISFHFYTHIAHNHYTIFQDLLRRENSLAEWYRNWLYKIQDFQNEKRNDIVNIIEEVENFLKKSEKR